MKRGTVRTRISRAPNSTDPLFDLRPAGSDIIAGDASEVLPELPACSFQCCVTSPPYWGLRDYGYEGQIGAEDNLADYIRRLVAVFREVRRVLSDDGTLWLNL